MHIQTILPFSRRQTTLECVFSYDPIILDLDLDPTILILDLRVNVLMTYVRTKNEVSNFLGLSILKFKPEQDTWTRFLCLRP